MTHDKEPVWGQLDSSGRLRSLASPQLTEARTDREAEPGFQDSNRSKIRIEFPVTHSKQRTVVLSNRNKSPGPR
jgi:hypothetical protein